VRGKELAQAAGHVLDCAQLARSDLKDEVIKGVSERDERHAVHAQKCERASEPGALVPIDEWMRDEDPLEKNSCLLGKSLVELRTECLSAWPVQCALELARVQWSFWTLPSSNINLS